MDRESGLLRIAATEERLSARIEKTETTLLTEFHKWASPVEMRQQTHSAVQRVTECEMAALCIRASKLDLN